METEPTVIGLLQAQVAELTRERMALTEGLVQASERAGRAQGELVAVKQQIAVVQMQADRAANDAAVAGERMAASLEQQRLRITELEQELARARRGAA